MVNRYLVRLLWGVGIVATGAAVALWLYGCAPPKEANEPTIDLALAVACSDVMNRATSTAPTCEEAERQINAAIVCRELKPDGYDLQCKEPNEHR